MPNRRSSIAKVVLRLVSGQAQLLISYHSRPASVNIVSAISYLFASSSSGLDSVPAAIRRPISYSARW